MVEYEMNTLRPILSVGYYGTQIILFQIESDTFFSPNKRKGYRALERIYSSLCQFRSQ